MTSRAFPSATNLGGVTFPDSTPSDPWSVPTPELPLPLEPVLPGPVIVQIGDMGVTSTLVHTPAGEIPLAGSTWTVNDYWHNEQKIPPWAIVAAVVGFCVLTVFSLLFLLVKQTVHRGTVQVTVTSGARQYVARIPVESQEQVQSVYQQVNYVRALAAL